MTKQKTRQASLDKKSKRECGAWGWALIVWLIWVITAGLVSLIIMGWLNNIK